MKTHHIQGANILKRAIEYMCQGPFDSDREDALDILNRAIEECFACEPIQRLCPECNRTPTQTDPENPNHIVCSRCDLECLLTPLSESERI